MLKTTGLMLTGFALGALAGFVFGQGARSSAPGAVTVDTQGSRLMITIDGGNVLQGGINALIGR